MAAEGLVYDFFRPEDAPDPPAGPFADWAVSCDHGTRNPSSFGLWGLLDGVWYRVDEYYHDGRAGGVWKTDEEHADGLDALVAGRPLRAVVADPAAAGFIETLRRRGYPVVKAKNDVLPGLRLTADSLKNGKIVVCNNCVHLLREIALYRWDDRAGYREAPRKEHDHAMDDMRYFAATVAGALREDPFPAARALERRI